MRVGRGGPPGRFPCRASGKPRNAMTPAQASATADSVLIATYAVLQHEASDAAISRRGPVPLAAAAGRQVGQHRRRRARADRRRARPPAGPAADPLLRYLVDEAPGRGREGPASPRWTATSTADEVGLRRHQRLRRAAQLGRGRARAGAGGALRPDGRGRRPLHLELRLRRDLHGAAGPGRARRGDRVGPALPRQRRDRAGPPRRGGRERRLGDPRAPRATSAGATSTPPPSP